MQQCELIKRRYVPEPEDSSPIYDLPSLMRSARRSTFAGTELMAMRAARRQPRLPRAGALRTSCGGRTLAEVPDSVVSGARPPLAF